MGMRVERSLSGLTELEPIDRYARMNDIVSLYIKGESVPKIMKKMGLRRVDVLEYLDEYKQIAINDPEVRARASETLHNFDMHTGEIIAELWGIVKTTLDDKVKAGALKSLADIDKARVETLQKAGLYDDAALGDEMAKVQEQAEQIKQLLKQVVEQYPETRALILHGINKIFDQNEGVTIKDEGGESPTP